MPAKDRDLSSMKLCDKISNRTATTGNSMLFILKKNKWTSQYTNWNIDFNSIILDSNDQTVLSSKGLSDKKGKMTVNTAKCLK